VHSWEKLISKNASSVIKRFEYLLSKNLIKKEEDILIAENIVSFLRK